MRLVVDSSALVAIVNNEPERVAFSRAISEAEVAFCSAATIYETGVVLLRTKPGDDTANAVSLAETFKLQVLPFTMEHAVLALEAYRRYGKGRGIRPHLNLGDCVAYALAKSLGAPLLFKGDDFPATDITPAI